MTWPRKAWSPRRRLGLALCVQNGALQLVWGSWEPFVLADGQARRRRAWRHGLGAYPRLPYLTDGDDLVRLLVHTLHRPECASSCRWRTWWTREAVPQATTNANSSLLRRFSSRRCRFLRPSVRAGVRRMAGCSWDPSP